MFGRFLKHILQDRVGRLEGLGRWWEPQNSPLGNSELNVFLFWPLIPVSWLALDNCSHHTEPFPHNIQSQRGKNETRKQCPCSPRLFNTGSAIFNSLLPNCIQTSQGILSLLKEPCQLLIQSLALLGISAPVSLLPFPALPLRKPAKGQLLLRSCSRRHLQGI